MRTLDWRRFLFLTLMIPVVWVTAYAVFFVMFMWMWHTYATRS